MVWAARILGVARRVAPLASFTLAGGAAMMACDSSSSSSSSSASGGGKNPRVWVHDALEGEGMLARKALGVDPDLLKARLDRMVLFSGSSNPPLAEEVAYELHKPLGKMSVNRFSDGETLIQALESVRGKDVYVIQSTSQPVNENLIELCLMVSALRRASARTITAIMPYYGYKRDVGTVSTLTHLIRHGIVVRQEQQQKQQLEQKQKDQADLEDEDGRLHGIVDGEAGAGGSAVGAATTAEAAGYSGAFPISAADVARMLETVGVDRILSVELQPPGMGQIEGFFPTNIPVESIRTTGIAVDFVSRLKLKSPVVVAPNESCIQLAHDIRTGLQKKMGSPVGLAAIMQAGPSRGSDRYAHTLTRSAAAPADGVERMELVGDVHGRDVIICDDMIDTAKTLMTRLDLLKERGAQRIVAYATHGLFTGAALQRITKSPLSDVVVTNTVPLREDVDTRHTHKIAQLSVAPLLAEAILRVQTGQSLQDLRIFDRDSTEPRYKGQE